MTALPISEVAAWKDSAGALHPTKEAALLVELERVLGRVGNGDSLAPGIAKMLVERRDQLLPLLEAFGPVVVIAPAGEAGAGR